MNIIQNTETTENIEDNNYLNIKNNKRITTINERLRKTSEQTISVDDESQQLNQSFLNDTPNTNSNHKIIFDQL